MVQITPEQLEALAQSENGCVRVLDPATNRRYLIVEEASVPEADAEHIEYMRKGLEEAEREIAEGRGVPWDPEEIKRLGRERLEQRTAPRQ